MLDRLAAPLAGDRDWTWQEVTGQIPDGAGMIQFGLVLRGPGRAEMRGAGLTAGGSAGAPHQAGANRGQRTMVMRSVAISCGSVTESNETTLTWDLPNLSWAWFFCAALW